MNVPGGRIRSVIGDGCAKIFAYDAVSPLRSDQSEYRKAHHLTLGVIGIFVVAGVWLIAAGAVENKPTTSSTDLYRAHQMVTLDPGHWIREGIWWRNLQTPTPLSFTIHGIFFALFGYSVRGILILHTLAGALTAWLLFRITARRWGPFAGLIAVIWCLSMPLFLYVAFAGWSFVWATLFLLLAFDLSDRAVLTQRPRVFLLAGLALGGAGMCRPENFAAALLFALFSKVRTRQRVAFLLLALAYPIARFLLVHLIWGDAAGLRILADARQGMSYHALFHAWFASVRANILNQNFSILFQLLLLPAVLCFGLPRQRLLAGTLAYFCAAFFAAYAVRRISFNHEGYYFAPLILLAPFLAAFLIWLGKKVRQTLARMGVAGRPALGIAVLLILAGMAADRVSLRASYERRLFFQVPEPVRALRDDLRARLNAEDGIVLDYFSEVSWMLAELESNAGRSVYYYAVNPSGESRPPVNAVRKDFKNDEITAMNEWVYQNYRRWQQDHAPRYVVALSEDAWAREMARKGATGHYRMYSLRAVAARHPDVRPESAAGARVVYANEVFVVYELEARPGRL